MNIIRPPDKLRLSDLDEKSFDVWLKAYEDYKRFSKHFIPDEAKKDPSLEVSLFLTLAGLEIRNLVDGLTHDGSYKNMLEAIRKYLRPITNTVVERHKFFSMSQLSDEELPQFIVRLKQQVLKCDFTNTTVDTIENQMIRDQLIKGMRCDKIRKALLKETDLLLKDAENIANSIQAAEENNKNFDSKQGTVLANYSSKRVVFNQDNPRKRDRSASQRRSMICYTCKKPGHLAKECYKNHMCELCHTFGRTEKVCRFKQKSKTETSRKGLTLTLTCALDGAENELTFISCTVNDKPVKELIDTGSTVCVINRLFVERNNFLSMLEAANFKAKLANGQTMQINECLKAKLNYEDTELITKFYVSDQLEFDCILGLHCIRKIGLKIGSNNGIILSISNPLVSEYADIFDKTLKDARLKSIQPLPIIELEQDAQPKQSAIRNFHKSDLKFVEEKISELLREGVIRKSNSAWRHQALVVPKDGGTGKRLVINYKPVNSVTKFDAYPLPNINELLEQIGNAKYYTKVDFSQFYHQLPLCESDFPKTAFYCNGELYEYTRCAFGLKNAVAYCFRVMKKVLEGQTDVVIYLDDLCIFGNSIEKHNRNLRNVMDRVRKHGLSLNLKKCSFCKEEVNFLGFTLKNGEKRPDISRYDSLLN